MTSLRKLFGPVAALSIGGLVALAPLAVPRDADAADAAGRWVVAQPSAQPYGPLLSATVADLAAWWDVEYPRLYGAPLPGGLSFHAGTPETPPPQCGNPRRRSYSGVRGNAFYCGFGDYIAWDDSGLFPTLAARRGNAALAMVMAHEAAHAVQVRAGVRLPSIYQELQADCFAGAWFAHVTSGKSDLRLEDGDLDNAIAALLGLRDRVGTDPRRGGAHGSGFDRVNAMQLGYEDGTGRCARFVSDPPRVTAAAYASAQEASNGGDLPLADALEALRTSLNSHWRPTRAAIERVVLADRDDLAACGAKRDASFVECDGALLVDGEEAQNVHRQIGDLGTGALLSSGWSAATGATASQSACRTGAWLAGATKHGLQLSPGDVDEAIIWTVVKGGAGEGSFERIRAFRTGYVNNAC